MSFLEQQADKLYKKGKKQAAVKLLAQKLQKDMSHEAWFLQLSSYLTAGGDLEQAEELLIKAKQLFPKSEEIDYNLAVIYFEANKMKLSQKYLKNIKNPKLLSDVYYLMAQEELKKKQPAVALAYVLTAIDKDASISDNYLFAGDLFLQLNNFKKSAQYYQKALNLEKSAAGYFKLALVEMVEGNKKYHDDFLSSKTIDQDYFDKHQQQLKDIEKFIRSQQKDD